MKGREEDRCRVKTGISSGSEKRFTNQSITIKSEQNLLCATLTAI